MAAPEDTTLILGVILLVTGAIQWILGAMGHAVAGRRHYW